MHVSIWRTFSYSSTVLRVLGRIIAFQYIGSLSVGVQTPNCIRQTVFDAVALDYQPVTVIVDATAAATPDIHTGTYFLLLERNAGL